MQHFTSDTLCLHGSCALAEFLVNAVIEISIDNFGELVERNNLHTLLQFLLC